MDKRYPEYLNSIMQFLQIDYRFERLPEITWENPSNLDDNKLVAFATAKVNSRSSLICKTYRRLPGFAKNLLKDSYYERMSRVPSSLHKETIPTDAKAFLQNIYFEDVQRLKEIMRTDSLPWEDFDRHIQKNTICAYRGSYTYLEDCNSRSTGLCAIFHACVYRTPTA